MKKIIVLFMALILILSVVSCTKDKEKEVQTNTETKTEEKENTEETKEKVLTAGVFWFPENLDPAQGWNGWMLSRVALGENLATVNENMEIVPQLADKWEKVDDTTWKFHIRQGVKFSNGKELTAEAVKNSLERVVKMDERAAANAKMKSIEVEGENVIFKTSEPYGSLVANLTEPLFTIIDTDASDEEIAKAPICTGPYKVEKFNPGVDFTLVKNEHYWDGETGLDKLVMKLIKDDDTRALSLKSGEIDIAQRLNGLSVKQFYDDAKYVVDEIPSLRVNYLCLNHNNEALKDLELRKAISYAIDRESIANITNTTATGAVFPESAGYGYDKIKKQEFNLEEAKRILKDAGYVDSDGDGIVEKDGKKAKFELSIVKKGDTSVIAESIQAELKAAGIEMEIKISENYDSQKEEKDFGALLLNYVTATTGDSKRFLEQNYSTDGTDNFGNYSSEEFDELITKLVSEFDLQKRKEITIEAQEVINKDVANIYITATKNNSVYNQSVKNITVFPIDYYFITKDTTVEE